jgi:hypothetical protein
MSQTSMREPPCSELAWRLLSVHWKQTTPGLSAVCLTYDWRIASTVSERAMRLAWKASLSLT